MKRYLRNVFIGVLLGLLGGLFLGQVTKVHARNLGQFDSDTDRARWFRSLMQPDNPAVPCCGEADGYYCDNLHTKTDADGKHTNWCTITDDRDDKPLGRVHVEVGTEIEIPDRKLMTGEQIHGANPVGHSIVFLSSAQYVWCFIFDSGL